MVYVCYIKYHLKNGPALNDFFFNTLRDVLKQGFNIIEFQHLKVCLI